MKETKVQLSGAEMELMCDASIILTKNKILRHVKELLEEVQEYMADRVSTYVENSILDISPKISKGENYLGLPYLILDYPRVFQQSGIFAIRSMFWWGHFFSSTLHLSGSYATTYRHKIEQAYSSLSTYDYFIGIHEDPWQHHFDDSNYARISSISKPEFISYCKQDHIKIAAQWPLTDWTIAGNHLSDSWELLLRICL